MNVKTHVLRWTVIPAAVVTLLASVVMPQAQASYMSAVLADGPEAYWRFEDGAESAILNGAPAADATGNHPGTYKAQGTGADGPQMVAGAPGIGGTAAHFVGTSSMIGDYIQFDTLGNVGSNIDNNGVTFEFLIKNPAPFSNASTNAHRLFGVTNDRPGGARKLTLSFGFSDLNLDGVTGNEDAIFLRDDSDMAWAYNTNNGNIDDGNWHHVAWVIDPGIPINGTRVYVDGNLITLTPSTTALFVPKAISNFSNFDKAFTIGAEDIFPGTGGVGLIRTFALNNIIDEFAVYSKALTQEQIANHVAQVPEHSTVLLTVIAFVICLLPRRIQ